MVSNSNVEHLYYSIKATIEIQWNLAITKCYSTEKNVRYSGIFVIVKIPL